MALSTGQITDTFQSTLGRTPTGSELQQYGGRSDLEGSTGQSSLAGELKGSSGGISAPNSPGDVNSYLQTYQTAINKSITTLNQDPNQAIQNIKSQILPNQPAPTTPNMVGTYNNLITSQGVTDLEKTLSNLKDQTNTINDQLEASTTAESNKPVAMNVIQGRQSQEQQQAQVQLDSLARQTTAVTDELSMRYNTIDTIMKYTQQDYDNAVKNYDEQYQQNVTVYQAFATQQNQAETTLLDATDKMANLDMQIQQQQRQSASANLQVYANMITAGNLKYANMTPDQRLSIQKLEVQSGLGVGFIENLTADNPNGKVLYAGPNGAVLQNQDGTLKTVNYNVSGKDNGGGITANQARGDLQGATSEMSQKLSGVANSYGNISPTQWKQAESAWTSAGLKTTDFIKNFSQYADPNRGDFENAYGFKKNVRSSAKPSNNLSF